MMLRSTCLTEKCGIGCVRLPSNALLMLRNVIKDDLFRQGPAPIFSSLLAVITMLFHANLNIHRWTFYCLFIFCHRLYFTKVFPFPPSKEKLIAEIT